MLGRRIAIACTPAILFGCTILTDLDSLQFIKDGGVIVDGTTFDSPGSDGMMMTDGGGMDADAMMMMSDADAMVLDTGIDTGVKVWMDDFNRANSNSVGNNWIMKTAGAIHILNNRAQEQNSAAGYQDNVVYRPMSEDVRDVTVSVEFQNTNLPPGYPQIMARIQQNTVQSAGTLDCYILFISNQANNAVLGRQRGTPYLTTLQAITLNPSVDTTHSFRLTLTASGANPVSLSAMVEMFTNNMWTKIGSTTYSDSNAQRLDTAGSVGIGVSGGEVTGLYSYDNFIRTSL
jgi:hypothetical protein